MPHEISGTEYNRKVKEDKVKGLNGEIGKVFDWYLNKIIDKETAVRAVINLVKETI